MVPVLPSRKGTPLKLRLLEVRNDPTDNGRRDTNDKTKQNKKTPSQIEGFVNHANEAKFAIKNGDWNVVGVEGGRMGPDAG